MLKLEALDTVYFGTGKPFNMDGDNWIDSMFPPAPSVLYGALRSAYFAENKSLIEKANKPDDPTLSLRLKGVFLLAENALYFPIPLDLVRYKTRNKDQVFLLELREHRWVSSCPTAMVLAAFDDQQAETVEMGLLDHLTMGSYLSGEQGGFPFRKLQEFVTREPKLGIGRNDAKRVAQDHLLYRIGMLRPESVNPRGKSFGSRKLNILLDYEGLELPQKGFVKLGGESKAAVYEHCDDDWIQNMDIQWPQHGNRFKFYPATPAKFSKGWLPGWVDENSLTGTYNGTKLKLLTAAVGKPVPIGGFDLKSGQPKPMMRAVPAGSVYYFEILDGTNLTEAMEKFHYVNVSDFDAQQGFGLAFAGVISS